VIMKKPETRSIRINWRIMIMLLGLLLASISLNVYFYIERIKPSHGYVTWALIDRIIQDGMGRVLVMINSSSGSLILHTEGNFSVFVSISLWDPYAGSGAYGFSFKLYERASHGEWSDTPIAEETVITQKDENAMSIEAHTTFNVNAPADSGVYIYKVVLGGEYDYELEFPIMAEP